jgi:hypothetical protein
MKLSIQAFAGLSTQADVVIHSLERALYQVTVMQDGEPCLLVDETGRAIRHHNLQRVREMLQTLPVGTITLRHESAYDEMIGQPPRDHSNALEVKLSPIDYPTTVTD